MKSARTGTRHMLAFGENAEGAGNGMVGQDLVGWPKAVMRPDCISATWVAKSAARIDVVQGGDDCQPQGGQ